MILRFYKSDIKLFADSNVAYLFLLNARSRIVGYFYLSDIPSDNQEPKSNTLILLVYKTLKNVMASAAKAETSSAFANA